MIKILHFYAEWSQDCEIQNNILEELSTEFDDVAFELVNVDYQETRARQYEIVSIPTLVIEVNNRPVTKLEGLVEQEDIEDIIDEIFDEYEEEEDISDA
ncbi:MAG: thioredoxin family protein [Candidatus Methanofastidiosia archaeon]